MTLGVLAFYYTIAMAYLPVDQMMIGDNYYYNEGSFQLNVDLELDITKYLFVGGYVNTKMMTSQNGKLSFAPYMAEYSVRAGARFDIDGIQLELAYEHLCVHPVSVYRGEAVNAGNSGDVFGGHDKISFSLSNRVK